MRFRFVTYRWGAELMGGAELHHRRLARELADLGHEVDVYTTDGGAIRPFCHWGIEWSRRGEAAEEDTDMPVRRFPLRIAPRWRMALEAKALQFLMEREEARVPQSFLEALLAGAGTSPGLYALNGWHHPEVSGHRPVRWTQPRANAALVLDGPSEGELRIAGQSPQANRLEIVQDGLAVLRRRIGPGWFDMRTRLAPTKKHTFLTFGCQRPWRPWRDFRALGFQIYDLEWHDNSGAALTADLWDDYRTLGRRSPELWHQHLLNRAGARPWLAGRFFDTLRGPNAPALRRTLAEEELPAGSTIYCNLPWATMSIMPAGALAMPLWHIEDDFFYWRHWLDRLKQSRLVLANNPYAAEHFYPRLGIPAAFVGPPIWQPETPVSSTAREDLRKRCGAAPEDILVLTVCRKSPEKRYEAVAEAVHTLRGEGVPVRMAGVGPDGDRRPFVYTGCEWLGPLSGEDLQAAYAACDVFALMSESESFGMVIPEAWHHGKPVLANRLCGPAASLLEDGVDGLAVTPGRELVEALRTLAGDPSRRAALGGAGRRKAMRLYVRGASAGRLLRAMEGIKHVRSSSL